MLLPPLWGMEDAWVQSYIYIGLKLAAPFPPPLPMPSSLLGSVRTHARTRQGRRGGLNGLRPRATDAHTRSTQARRHYAVLCTAESMYIMRSMQEYLYIVMISSRLSVFSELIRNYERNKIDIWWRSLERVHVSGLISKCYIYLYSVPVEVLLPAEFIHQNPKNRCSLERVALLQFPRKIIQHNING